MLSLLSEFGSSVPWPRETPKFSINVERCISESCDGLETTLRGASARRRRLRKKRERSTVVRLW